MFLLTNKVEGGDLILSQVDACEASGCKVFRANLVHGARL
jgi:hypothetical protein